MSSNQNAKLVEGLDIDKLAPLNVVAVTGVKASAFDPMAVLNSFSDALLVISSSYDIVYSNTKAKSLVGLADTTSSYSSLSDFIPSKWLTKVLAYIDSSFAGKGSSCEVNARQVHNDCWWQLTFTPVWNAEGEVVNVCITIKDITELKRIELFKQELQAYEEKLFLGRELFEQFMENAPFPAWVSDDKGIMHYMNPLYRTANKFSITDTGKSLCDLYPGQRGVDYYLSNLEVIQKEKPVEYIRENKDETGNLLLEKIFKFPLSFNGIVMVSEAIR